MAPHWPGLISDRARPLRDRMLTFYGEYTAAIFTYEWMRIFMAAGLAGEALNRRYLEHVRDVLLAPLMAEVRHEARGDLTPTPRTCGTSTAASSISASGGTSITCRRPTTSCPSSSGPSTVSSAGFASPRPPMPQPDKEMNRMTTLHATPRPPRRPAPVRLAHYDATRPSSPTPPPSG